MILAKKRCKTLAQTNEHEAKFSLARALEAMQVAVTAQSKRIYDDDDHANMLQRAVRAFLNRRRFQRKKKLLKAVLKMAEVMQGPFDRMAPGDKQEAFEEMLILASEKELQLIRQEAGIVTAGFESDPERIRQANSSSVIGQEEQQSVDVTTDEVKGDKEKEKDDESESSKR